jgi:catechol 2,3-dioxygenase-like lactoylglutathione lyase family enzyme
MGGAPAPGLGWQALTPTLPVRDVHASLAWYRDALGCRIAWVWDDGRLRGVTIAEPLEYRPWGMREFAVRDPDGHVLRFGHGEKTVAEIPRFRTAPSA